MHRRSLLVDLAISVAGGLILAASARTLAVVARIPVEKSLPTWLFVSTILVAAVAGYLLTLRWHRTTAQAYILVSAFVQKHWLAEVLENLIRSLDRQGIDLVVKLPAHDYGDQSQIQQMASMRKKRRSYIGGFVVAAHPEQMQGELAAFCRSMDSPVVFVDVRPFPRVEEYPDDTAFVGCDADEIGEKAAAWVIEEMTERGNETPTILVVGGPAHAARYTRFESQVRQRLPRAEIIVNLLGGFVRDNANEIVARQLRQVRRRGGRLDVVYCTNDDMALGAVDAIQDQVAPDAEDLPIVVGVDGTDEAVATIRSGGTPFQATIVQDSRRIAEVAVGLLLRMIEGGKVPTETTVPVTVYPMQ